MYINNSEQFIVIFGSIARNDYTENSDVDILTINIEKHLAEKYINNINIPNFPHNYVEYDSETFTMFYNSGSLFLYHIFTQGMLIHGNIKKWQLLKNNFNVKEDFKEEILKIKEEASAYSNIKIFDNHFTSAISNLYPMIKNLCIFSLANKGIYEFNKDKCITLYINDRKLINAISKAKTLYNYSEKSINIPNIEKLITNKERKEIIKKIYNKIIRIYPC